jgi:GT2 family glycosyltransferase
MSHTAVVILNYNGEKLLPKFLPSVLKFSDTAEIIIADNGSTDNSLALLEKDFPTIRIIRLPENLGFCGGYNQALKMVRATYFILLNSDVEVTSNWILPMLAILESNANVSAVQPKILSYNNRTLFEYAGAGGGFIDALGYPFCRGRLFNHVEEDHNQYDDERPVFWATGACMMIRSSVYQQFGGLDEDFFAHMEEIDLCWKIHRAGKLVYYTGRSKVYHLGAGTLGYATPRKTYLNFRNGLAMITKHFNMWEIWWKLPLRICLDWLAAVVFLIQGESVHCKAVFEAHMNYAKSLKTIMLKRKQLQEAYPNYNKSGIFSGIALIHYFLFRKKKLL